MDIRFGWVYAHLNKINNKIYIGITTKKKPQYRWGIDGSGYLKSKGKNHFKNAILKYGWNNFNHYLLMRCPVEWLDHFEKYFIALFHSDNPKLGYNSNEGGNANKGANADVRQKISDNSKRMWHEKGTELRKIYSSKEHKKKISEGIKNAYLENPELRENISKHHTGITNVINKENDIKQITEEEIPNYLAKGYIKGRVFVMPDIGQALIDDYIGKEDLSINELRKKYNLSYNVIKRYLIENDIELVDKSYKTRQANIGIKHSEAFKEKHKEIGRKSSKDTIWINNSKETKHVKKDVLQKYLNKGWVIGRLKINNENMKHEEHYKAVKCIETDIIYKSLKEAELQTDINHKVISSVCRHKAHYKTAGGYHWEFV